jgi:NADPH:quinone reductase-like Zn-dependent oxidoreductase
VCGARNLDLVRSIGADRAIDYAREDFTKNGETYDVIFDAVGKHSFKRCKGSLNTGGRYLATDGFTNVILGIWTKRFGDKKVIFEIPPRYTKQDIIFLKTLIEARKYKAVIDRRYSMDEVVEAARYVETGRKTGNVVLTISAA